MKKSALPVQGAQQEENRKSRVGDVIVTVVLVLAILIAILAGYSAYASKAGSGVPSILGFRPFSVQSDSMVPTFYKGDLVIDRVVNDPASLQVGDIITFWTIINGQRVLNTHRIIEISDFENYLYFDTKGDNNPIADTVGVHQNDIVGIYLTRLPNVGTVLDFLQTSTGFALCIVLPVAIFFLYELIAFFRTLMAYQAEKIRLQMQDQAAALAAAAAAAAPPSPPQPEAKPKPKKTKKPKPKPEPEPEPEEESEEEAEEEPEEEPEKPSEPGEAKITTKSASDFTGTSRKKNKRTNGK